MENHIVRMGKQKNNAKPVLIEYPANYNVISSTFQIKATKLIELPGNIESVDIEAFYKEYREKLKDPEAPDSLAEFLNG